MLVSTVFALFRVFDWNHGIVRALLLAALGVLAWRWRHSRRSAANAAAGRWSAAAIAFAIAGAVVNLDTGAHRILESRRSGTLPSDQSQTVIAALRVARSGGNPWARTTAIDGAAYDLAIAEFQARPGCAAPVPAPRVPVILDNSECARLRDFFSALGFKYGPAMLAFYAPFVTLLGAAGIATAHLLLFLTLVVGLAIWIFDRHQSSFVVAAALLPTLLSTQISWNALDQGHLDLLPTLLGGAAVWCLEYSAFGTAAALLGASISAKVLPGLLFVPLLLKAPRRFLVWSLAIPVACGAPFAFWDWRGFWLNIAYPFMRSGDSTSLMFVLPPWAQAASRLAAVAALIVAGVVAHRRQWTTRAGTDWLVAAHLLVLGVGATFHNNYLVWLLPLFALLVITDSAQQSG